MLLGIPWRRYAISLIGAALVSGWVATSATAQRGNGRIAFVSVRADVVGVYSVRPDGRDLQPLVLDSDFEEFDPSWSPDGSRIAFASHSFDGGSWSIDVIEADGDVLGSVAEYEDHAVEVAVVVAGRQAAGVGTGVLSA